jgi:hypothetical protein
MHLETSATVIHISRQGEREKKQRIDFSRFCHTLAENTYFISKNKQPDYVCITFEQEQQSSTRHSMQNVIWGGHSEGL